MHTNKGLTDPSKGVDRNWFNRACRGFVDSKNRRESAVCRRCISELKQEAWVIYPTREKMRTIIFCWQCVLKSAAHQSILVNTREGRIFVKSTTTSRAFSKDGRKAVDARQLFHHSMILLEIVPRLHMPASRQV